MKNSQAIPNNGTNILYLNPLSDFNYNETFANSLKGYITSGISISLDVASLQPTSDLPVTLDNLGYRAYESLIMGPTVQVARLGSIANPTKRYDAMVIGCFYDPALFESRSISGQMHVVAPCQASCQIASNLGNKFSIIIGMDYWQDQMESTIYQYGYKDYLVSFETLNIPANQLPVDPKVTLAAIKKAAIAAINKGAESIILGCTLELGTYYEVEQYLLTIFGKHVPVIDPSLAAYKTAERLAYNRGIWSPSRVHGMESPPEADLKKYNVFQTEYKLSHIVSVSKTR